MIGSYNLFRRIRRFPGPLLLVVGSIFAFSGCLNAPLPPEGATLDATLLREMSEDHEGIEVILPGTAYRGFTNREGRVVFDNLPPREYEILATSEGYRPYREEKISLTAGERYLIGEVTLAPIPTTGRIEGQVVVDNIPDATVEVRLKGTDLIAASLEGGDFEFAAVPPGEYNLAFHHSGYAAEKPVSVSIEAGLTVTLGKITLKKAVALSKEEGTLQGRIFLEGTKDFGGVSIGIQGSSSLGLTSADGTYHLDQVPSGTQTILFEKAGYEPYAIPRVVIASGTVTEITSTVVLLLKSGAQANLQVKGTSPPTSPADPSVDPDTPGIIAGWAFYPDGSEHSGIIVRLLNPPGLTETDSDGSFRFAEVPPGLVTLRAEAEAFTAAQLIDLEVRPGEVTRAPHMVLQSLQPFHFEQGGGSRIYGQVLLEGERTYLGTFISLEGTTLTAMTARDGTFLIDGVSPGQFTLLVDHEGFQPVSVDLDVPPDSEVPVQVLTLIPEEIYLEVVETRPADGTRKVEVSDHVHLEVQFNERILGRTIRDAVNIYPPVAFDLDLFGVDLLSIDLLRLERPKVEFDTNYTVVIDDGVQSVQGYRLAEPYSFEIKTGGPRVLGTFPPDGTEDFLPAADQSISIDFNMAVDIKQLRQSIRIRPDIGSVPMLVPQLRPFGMSVEIQLPTLTEKKTYKITIPRNVRTRGDHKRYDNTPYTFRFRTGSYGALPDVNDEYLDEVNDFLDF